MTPDELFHCGEWLDRFRRTPEALRCYAEALRRDPADSRVNLELGLLAAKQARFEDALRYFDKAAGARRRATPGSSSGARREPRAGPGDDAYEASGARRLPGEEAATARLALLASSSAAATARRRSTGCGRPSC